MNQFAELNNGINSHDYDFGGKLRCYQHYYIDKLLK
jgi:hypothetical protein